MSANYYDLLKYAATGQASPSMTYYDRMRASMLMGGAVQTLTGIPPLSFKANGKPLISWSMKGNGQQNGTPSPQNIVPFDGTGERTGNLCDESTIQQGYYGSSGSISTFTSGSRYRAVKMPIKAGTYTIKIQADEGIRLLRIATENEFYNVQEDNRSYTFIISADATMYVSWRNPSTTDSFTNMRVMLNLGSTALPYEPYGYKIPLTCAGQTTPVYLGQTQTVRRVRRIALTGSEINISKRTSPDNSYSISISGNKLPAPTVGYGISSHFVRNGTVSSLINGEFYVGSTAFSLRLDDCVDAEAFKSYLAAQYAAGTPVVIWYVLANEETAVVNEPLMKIGDYADELTTTTPIPTAKGSNTLSVDTTVQPSEVSITGNIKPTT